MINKTKSDFLITLGEAKEQAKLRNTFDQDDAIIQRMVKSAVSITEAEIQKDIATTSNVMDLQVWSGSCLKVNEGNLVSVDSITTKEGTDPEQALSDYLVYIYGDYFRVVLDAEVSTDLLTITFTTGYTVNTLPHDLKQACLIKFDDLYDVDRASSKFVSIKDSGVFERICAKYKAQYVDTQRES